MWCALMSKTDENVDWVKVLFPKTEEPLYVANMLGI
jgi:hypothetical protein